MGVQVEHIQTSPSWSKWMIASMLVGSKSFDQSHCVPKTVSSSSSTDKRNSMSRLKLYNLGSSSAKAEKRSVPSKGLQHEADQMNSCNTGCLNRCPYCKKGCAGYGVYPKQDHWASSQASLAPGHISCQVGARGQEAPTAAYWVSLFFYCNR